MLCNHIALLNQEGADVIGVAPDKVTNLKMEGREMAKCGKCAYFHRISDSEDDYEKDKGDCIIENKDEKGKFWTAKPVFDDTESCNEFKKKISIVASS